MLLEERTEDLRCCSSTNDQCIFVLMLNIALIALLNPKDIRIRPT